MDGSSRTLRMKECFHLEQSVEDSVAQDYTKPIRVKHLFSEVCLCATLAKTARKKLLVCSLGTVCSIDVLFLACL